MLALRKVGCRGVYVRCRGDVTGISGVIQTDREAQAKEEREAHRILGLERGNRAGEGSVRRGLLTLEETEHGVIVIHYFVNALLVMGERRQLGCELSLSAQIAE